MSAPENHVGPGVAAGAGAEGGAGSTAAKAPRGRRGGVVVPHRPTWLQRAGGILVFLAIRSLAATTRFRLVDCELATDIRSRPCIFAIWHNRLAFCLMVYRYYIQRQVAGRRMAAIVSASKDGGFLSTILECFGVEPVRGSSSRRGAQAMRELVTWAERGFDLAITPDGPRGPRHVVQEGAVALAQLTGLPVLPVSYRLTRKRVLKSWDGFMVPLPFGCCEVRVGAPVRVPREATAEEREALRLKIQQTMRELGGDDAG